MGRLSWDSQVGLMQSQRQEREAEGQKGEKYWTLSSQDREEAMVGGMQM